MSKAKTSTLDVRGTAISILTDKDGDFVSLTDMLKAKDGEFFISDWLRNRNTVEFLGIWESLNNPDFKPLEFEGFRNRAGLNSFVLTNLESLNSVLTRQGLPQPERLATLNDIAITQLRTLLAASSAKRLK